MVGYFHLSALLFGAGARVELMLPFGVRVLQSELETFPILDARLSEVSEKGGRAPSSHPHDGPRPVPQFGSR